MFEDHQDSILRSIESSFLQRSVSAPPIAENVGSAHIPQWNLGDHTPAGQEVRGLNDGLYYNYAPSSLNPRLPKQFPKHDTSHDHELLRGLAHDSATELVGGFADEQSIQREYGLSIHAQSGGKTPLDQIQEDFPTTPSRIFGDSATSKPMTQNGGALDTSQGMQTLGNGAGRLRMMDNSDVDVTAAMQHLNLGGAMQDSRYAAPRGGQYVSQVHPAHPAHLAHHARGPAPAHGHAHAHAQPQMMDRRVQDAYYVQPGMAAPRAARPQMAAQYTVDSRGYPTQQFVYASMEMPAYPQEMIYQTHEPRTTAEMGYVQYHPQQAPHSQPTYWQDGARTVMIPQMTTRDGQPLHVPVHMVHMYQQSPTVMAHQQPPPRMTHPPKIIPPQPSPQLSPTVMSPTDDKNKGTPRRDGSDRRDRGGRNDSRGVQPPRDSMVEEFRNTFGKTRQWELQDLRGHVVAFCQDQHGSRFIQQKLEEAVEIDKQLVFDEILPHAHALMKDVFGNYVVQKLFEYGTNEQRSCLASLLVGQAVPLALQMYGCRVIQKALEYVDQPRLLGLVAEFEGQVLRCVHDQNGNHVIQKCIEVVSRVAREAPADQSGFLSGKIQFIIDAFHDRVKELAMHPYGCRVIQRILEHCTNSQKAFVLEEIRHCCHELIRDQYGNYVIQHVMQHGWANDKAILLGEVKSHILEFSQHKFASNVVEKCMQFCSKIDRDEMIEAIMALDARGTCVLEAMLRDPYANYVVQRIIEVADERHRERIVKYVQDNIVQLRRYTYGKHIIAKLEKITGQRL